MPRFTDDELDIEVLHLLKQHRGRTNPIGRWGLVEKIFGPVSAAEQNDGNFSDRAVRESVERLRRRGVLICDMGDGTGRFLANGVEEYQSFRLRYGSRAFAIMDTLREMDRAAEQEWENPLQPRLI